MGPRLGTPRGQGHPWNKNGFVALGQLIPPYLYKPAFDAVVKYLQEVAASFIEGKAIPMEMGLAGFDLWHKLPAEVWERKGKKNKTEPNDSTFKFFLEEAAGFKMDSECGLVTEVLKGQQAERLGVQPGWQVLKFGRKPFDSKLAEGFLDAGGAIFWPEPGSLPLAALGHDE